MAPLRRILAAITQLAMLLPFVTVSSCTDPPRETTLSVIDLYTTENWWIPALTSAMALLFLGWPVGRDAAVGDAVRAVGAGCAAGATLLCLVLLSLFEGSADPRSGFWLTIAGWVGVWIACLSTALPATRKEPGRADPVLVALVAGLPALLAVEMVSQGGEELLDTLAAVAALAVFLIPVASLAVVVSRRDSRSAAPVVSRTLVAAALGLAWLTLGGGAFEVSAAFPFVGAAGAAVAFARVVWRPRGTDQK